MRIIRIQGFINPIRLQTSVNLSRNFSVLSSAPSNGNQHQTQIIRPSQFRSYASTSGGMVGLWQMLSNSSPVAFVQGTLTAIHDYSGLPWWGTIVVSTILFRSVITLPLAVYQYKTMARIENITLEMPALVDELKKEAAYAKKKYNWTDQQTRMVYNRSLKKQWNKLVVRDNCHPAKTLIVLWGQIPLWICQSVALRNLVNMLPDPMSLQAQIIFTEMTIGGFGWIPNLTEVDSSYILPVALGVINLGIVEIQSILRTRQQTRLQKYATNAFRGLSVLMIPIACSVPSALCVYWFSSSVYGLAQNLLLVSPEVRRSLGIPQMKSEISNPYERIWSTIKMRTGQMKTAPNTKSIVSDDAASTTKTEKNKPKQANTK